MGTIVKFYFENQEYIKRFNPRTYRYEWFDCSGELQSPIMQYDLDKAYKASK